MVLGGGSSCNGNSHVIIKEYVYRCGKRKEQGGKMPLFYAFHDQRGKKVERQIFFFPTLSLSLSLYLSDHLYVYTPRCRRNKWAAGLLVYCTLVDGGGGDGDGIEKDEIMPV